MNEFIIAAGVGFFSTVVTNYIATERERHKLRVEARRSAEEGIIISRIKAYTAIWKFLEETSPIKVEDGSRLNTSEKKAKLLDDLLSWYYTDGNGVFLSDRGVKCFDCLIQALKDKHEADYIKKLAQGLRSMLKGDLYGINEQGEFIGDFHLLDLEKIDCDKDDPCNVKENRREVSIVEQLKETENATKNASS